MPYPEGHKIKVRGKIIESAAKAFRTNGIRDISVPHVMKGAGLTHGGFYSHFDSKDQLVAETCRYAISDTIEALKKMADAAKKESKIDAVIDYYLSPNHRDNTEIGCILPSLSGEIPHLPEEVKQVFTSELERVIDFISDLGQIDTTTGRALLSMLVGTLVLARSVSDPKLSDSLLAAGKQHAKKLIKV